MTAVGGVARAVLGPVTAVAPAIDAATAADIEAIARLEALSFDSDALSRRSLRRLLTRPTAQILVAHDAEGGLVGSAILLFRGTTALARLYSLAVDPAARGTGIGRALLLAAEAAASTRAAAILRLEVRVDNAAAIGLYRSEGYEPFGRYAAYYADRTDALRLQKRLLPRRIALPVSGAPFYAQTLPFTCGPASLSMAMAAQDPRIVPDRTLELTLWREATTVFMTRGHGGCGPLGLALAAHRRGFPVRVRVTQSGPLFARSVRHPDKRAVLHLVHEAFAAEATAAGIPVEIGPVEASDLDAALAAGWIPVVLTSQWRILGEKAPHWMTLIGGDDRYFFAHDPDTDPDDEHASDLDCFAMPILRAEFERVARYGRGRMQAAVFVGPPTDRTADPK